jgi:hypothetical protein
MAAIELDGIQSKVLDTVRTTQDSVVDAVKGVAELLPTLPYPEQLPKPAEVVDSALGFAGKVFEAQKSFAQRVVAAIPVGQSA